jgi:dephospho-CoA kinase
MLRLAVNVVAQEKIVNIYRYMKIRIKEVQNTPQAIFLAGPAGAGKSFVAKSLPLSKFHIINVDDTYEELLKASGMGMKQKDFDPEQLSQAAKLMGQAQKATKEKYAKALAGLNDIIVDGTGAASRPLLKKKAELEALGYETMMLMVYVSPITSLERNMNRDRSLLPSIVLRTWRDINNNIDTYKEAFSNNFIIVDNNPENAETGFDENEIKRRFFDTSKAKGKPKTPEELAKLKADREELNRDIKFHIKQKPKFTPKDQAVSKVKEFIK